MASHAGSASILFIKRHPGPEIRRLIDPASATALNPGDDLEGDGLTNLEEYLAGKDLSVGIIGNPLISYTTLPIIEEDYSVLPPELPRICGYEAKWDPGSPYWNIKSIPARLSEEVERFLQASCVKLFERLGCRDYARFDWRLDDNGTPRLLEVNPNPGWCWDGHLAKMAALEGMSYDTMLDHILGACRKRISVTSAGITVLQ